MNPLIGIIIILSFCREGATAASNETQFNPYEEMITFRVIGELSPNYDVAHISSYLNLSHTIKEYNAMATNLETARKSVLSANKSKTFSRSNVKVAFITLRKRLQRTQEMLEFLCLLISCTDEITPGHSQPKGMIRPKFVVELKEDKEPGEMSKLMQHGTWWKSQFNQTRKRNAFLGLLGLLGIGMSGYNMHEIRNLKADLLSAKINRQRIASVLVKEDSIVKNNIMEIQLIEEQLNDYATITEKLLFWQQIEMSGIIVDAFTANIDEWINGFLTAAINRRMTPRMFSIEGMKKALDGIQTQAGFHGLELASPEIKDMLTEDLSFIPDEQGIFLILHLPLVEKLKMQLFQYLPSPVQFRVDHFVIPDPHSTFLAITADQTKTMALTQQQLQTCNRKGLLFLCDLGLTHTHVLNTCIGSLYNGDILSISETCTFNSLKTRRAELIVQTGKLQIKIFPHPRKVLKVHATCPIASGDSRSINLTSPLVLNLAPGCEVTTFNYYFKASQGFNIKENFISRPVFDFSNLTNLKFQLPQTNWRNLSYNPQTITQDQLDELTASSPQRHTNSVLVAVVLVLLTALMIGLGYILWRVWENDRKRKKESKETPQVEMTQWKGSSQNSELLAGSDPQVVKLDPTDRQSKRTKLMDLEVPFIKFKFAT